MENKKIEFNTEAFWGRVMKLAAEHSVSLKTLSLQLGYGIRSLENLKLNRNSPRADMLLKMALYFDVSLDLLITGMDSLPKKSDIEKTRQLSENIKTQLDIKSFRMEQSILSRSGEKMINENSELHSKMEEIKKLSSI